MKLNISGRELNVRNDLKAITEKRIAKLEKFFDANATLKGVINMRKMFRSQKKEENN